MMYGSCTDTVLARIVSPHFDDVLAKRQKACWTLLVYRPILTCLLVGYAQRNYNKKTHTHWNVFGYTSVISVG